MRPVLSSALSGAVAGIPMTLFMSYMHRRLPRGEKEPLPPKQITTDVMKDIGINRLLSEKERKALTMLSHFGYSIIVGSLYGVLSQKLKRRKILGGTGFGLVVWSVSYMGWVPLVGWGKSAFEETSKRNALMMVAHLIWGSSIALSMDMLERREKLAGF